MKVKSEKSLSSGLVILGTPALLFMIFGLMVLELGLSIGVGIIGVIILALSFFFLWIWVTTEYELTDTEFRYKSGPLKGSFLITDIHTIIKNKQLWSGKRPALGTSGLIIRYHKHREIYVSPKNRDKVIEHIVSLNPDISLMNDIGYF